MKWTRSIKHQVLSIKEGKPLNDKWKMENGKHQAALLAALIYWLVHGLVDVPYFKNDLALEFWVLLALLESLTSLRKPND